MNPSKKKIPAGEVRFRASGVGALMVGGNTPTDKQLARLEYLEERNSGSNPDNNKPLTANMKAELKALREKVNAPFELSQTAKSFVRDTFLKNEFGFRRPVVTPEILKGQLCEQDSFALLDEAFPLDGGIRIKNKTRFNSEDFTGEPDALPTAEIVEDVKTSWDLLTFLNVQEPPELYLAQGQVYMQLTGRKKFFLRYCLVPTPEELIQDEIRRFFYKFGGADSSDFKRAEAQIRHNNDLINDLPPSDRVKTFEFEYNPEYLDELSRRVVAAREYYAKLERAPFALDEDLVS